MTTISFTSLDKLKKSRLTLRGLVALAKHLGVDVSDDATKSQICSAIWDTPDARARLKDGVSLAIPKEPQDVSTSSIGPDDDAMDGSDRVEDDVESADAKYAKYAEYAKTEMQAHTPRQTIRHTTAFATLKQQAIDRKADAMVESLRAQFELADLTHNKAKRMAASAVEAKRFVELDPTLTPEGVYGSVAPEKHEDYFWVDDESELAAALERKAEKLMITRHH